MVSTEHMDITVVEHDSIMRNAIIEQLADLEHVRTEESLAAAAGAARQAAGCRILVCGPSQVRRTVFDEVGSLVRTHPGCGALLVTSDATTEIVRAALRAGFDDAIAVSRIATELLPAIEELTQRLGEGSRHHRTEAVRQPDRSSRIMTVFSPKGGAGRSVLSVNLAVALAQLARRRVIVLDTDPLFGDVSMLLKLAPVHTITDAISVHERLDPMLLESLLTHSEPYGVSVLAAPTDPLLASKLTGEAAGTLVEVLRGMGELVVVDTPRTLDDPVMRFLHESEDIVLVVGLDLPSLKNARLALQTLELANVPLDRILLILNRADSHVQLTPRELERVLEMKIDVTLPADGLVARSVNAAEPAVALKPRSRFAEQVRAVAELIVSRCEMEVRR